VLSAEKSFCPIPRADITHWKSAVDIEAEIETLPEIESLQRLHEIWTFWKGSVLPEDYAADVKWVSLVSLTREGEELRSAFEGQLGCEPADLIMALFLALNHHAFFIDWSATDVEGIVGLFRHEILSSKLKLPHRFGRLLYDRFNDLNFIERTDHLLPKDTRLLLDGTPIGVYQVGPLVSGPLGLILSETTRYIPPGSRLPLWHCSDSGCRHLHSVKLIAPRIAVIEALDAIERKMRDSLGPASEWFEPIARLHRKGRWADGRPYIDLPILVADGLIGKDRTTLTAFGLRSNKGDVLRSILRQTVGKGGAEGDPNAVAERLTPEQQLQLMMVLPDETVVSLIDEVVTGGAVRIPIGEIRSGRQSPPHETKDSACELSGLGVRSVLGNQVINLVSTISRTYNEEGDVNELQWRLGTDLTSGTEQALVDYIRIRGPRVGVDNLILASGAIAKRVGADVCASIDALRRDALASDHLLWKLGFDPIRFEEPIVTFSQRISSFRDTVLKADPIDTEDKRGDIRSVGVNLFVSVEQFLSLLLSFNVWLLSSDHFLGTQFAYDEKIGLAVVGEVLGASLGDADAKATWASSGANTLGVLLRYLDEALRWMESLPRTDRTSLQRPQADLPHYTSDKRRPFPHNHLQLWADADPSQLREFIAGFSSIVRLLNQAQLAAVRNGIDHYREPDAFPTADTMLGCAARLDEAVQRADTLRYFPKLWWLTHQESDQHGNGKLTLIDYSSRQLVSYTPSLTSGGLTLDFRTPYLVAPGNLLGRPNSQIFMTVKHRSEFADYWKGYPRRRRLPPENSVEESPSEL
jgi:hypothetical protein